MIFTEIQLGGAYLVELQKRRDARGYFARSFCQDEFKARGLATEFVQCNVSFNEQKGTVRGMHYQQAPHAEVKLVRCTAGAVLDVIVDLRPESPTFRKWAGVELSAGSGNALYVPAGFAHGYLALTDGAEVFYQVSAFYHPESERGVRWNDPAFGIDWPFVNPDLISDKDRAIPDFDLERR